MNRNSALACPELAKGSRRDKGSNTVELYGIGCNSFIFKITLTKSFVFRITLR